MTDPEPGDAQLGFFEQLDTFPQAEYVEPTSSAFFIDQNSIDHILRLGSNTHRHRERIIAAFEEQNSTAEIADILKNLYHGGNGIGGVTAWYTEDGIHLSHGKTARYDKSAQVVSWETAERIGQLLENGQFATNVELVEAQGYKRTLLAQQLWYLYHDFSNAANDAGYLPSLAKNPARGFPEETTWLAEQLEHPEFRQSLTEEYAAFQSAYRENPNLLRFHHHKLQEISDGLHTLALPRVTFSSALTEIPIPQQFITDDEIDVALSSGSGIAGGKGRIFAFFQENHTEKEKADFLKHEYGLGGHSHALSRAVGSSENHDTTGLRYKKDGCPEVRFTWEAVSKWITKLIRQDRYLTSEEQVEHDKIQAEKAQAEADAMQAQQPDPAVWEYNGVKERHPDDIKNHLRPYGDGKGGTYFGATGCGKTYTMLFLSRLIAQRDNEVFHNPTIIILTDREDLDTQTSELFVTATKYLHESDVRSIESREDLERTLKNRPSGGVYITTIQKFCEKTGLLSDRNNIICISDEAHRTQTGVGAKLKKTEEGVFTTYGFGHHLRTSFPNATYCGFTGTPIDETITVFGDVVDTYTMKESSDDGITVRIAYEPRLARVLLSDEQAKEIQKYYDNMIFTGSMEDLLSSYRLIKGKPCDLTADLEKNIFGLRKTAMGFEGLITANAAVEYKHCVLDTATIDDIIICIGKGGTKA